MNKEQYLLQCLSEECAEVSQRCSKAIRFGLLECEPNQELNNLERLNYELNDLEGVIQLFNEYVKSTNARILGKIDADKIKMKKEKIIKYMNYSQKIGILNK